MGRITEEAPAGISAIEICAFDRGVLADCLEGSCRFVKSGEHTEGDKINLVAVEEGKYVIEGSSGSILTEVELRLKAQYSENYRIGYQICTGAKQWSQWKWDGEPATCVEAEAVVKPITNIRIRLDEKRVTEPGIPMVCYRADTVKKYNWPAANGDPVDGGGKNIKFLWLSCTIDGKYVDCLKCQQHLEYLGDQSVPYWDSHYCFGKENHRLEGVKIELKPGYEDYQIFYCADVEGKGWQAWVQDGKWAGTKGQSKGIHGIRIEVRRREGK